MCNITEVLCPRCHNPSPKSRTNRCFLNSCTPEKTARYVSQRELDTDFLCHNGECVYNDMEFVVRWIHVNYGDKQGELYNALVPLAAQELEKSAEGHGE